MLTVREVAEALVVCRATVYALLERGALERVWVGGSIRISAASLEALLARGTPLMLGPVVPGSHPPIAGTGTFRAPSLSQATRCQP
ncbi:helix-turn-helix domain-containing protein [Corallococcus caeni]|uniref:helix-turn-helix domain-containing protein n=1 Tax=Corallococcus caeni TaxID=3082388 RepID=UPI0030C7623E